METKVKKREWVKTAAIIFLVVLLVLTLFSNTIMNRSLPEVATQVVNSGTINARIRGSGTVAANETYDVTISQTRKIASVLCKVGQPVNAGDRLFLLESSESVDLTAARQELEAMELAYEKTLIEATNAASMEDRQIQKLQQDYYDAVAVYNQYSTLAASQIKQARAEAEKRLKELERILKDAENALSGRAEEKAELQAEMAELEGRVSQLRAILDKGDELMAAENTLQQDMIRYGEDHARLLELAGYQQQVAMSYARYPEQLIPLMDETDLADMGFTPPVTGEEGEEPSYGSSDPWMDRANALAKAYLTIEADYELLYDLNEEVERLLLDTKDVFSLEAARQQYNTIFASYESYETVLETFDVQTEQYELAVEFAKVDVENQQEYISDLNSAESAAEMVKATQEALEDAIFQQSLTDSSQLDVEAAKEAIEEKRAEIEKLETGEAEEDVLAKVSGVISAIHITAGNTIGPESPLCTIEVVDRGYTLNIPVTNEQAKKVKIGDSADLVNYWGGDIDAILENVTTDPANPGKGKLLVFRLTGEVEPGINLTLSIGQKSANYDCLVPNSAVRTDSNGSFVLVMVAKSSPLGNRFTAVRADVQVLASDDTMSAVTGLSSGDFVITTSTEPIEAGQQVRQVEEG